MKYECVCVSCRFAFPSVRADWPKITCARSSRCAKAITERSPRSLNDARFRAGESHTNNAPGARAQADVGVAMKRERHSPGA